MYGTHPTYGEATAEAWGRYGDALVSCLQRAHVANLRFLVVTHAEALTAALGAFPNQEAYQKECP